MKLTRDRLEALTPAAGDVLERLVGEGVPVECPSCGEKFQAGIPGQLALKAATAVLDRTGFGPKSTVEHQKAPEQASIQGIVSDLLMLPLGDREALAASILPEYAVRLLPASCLEPSSVIEGEVVDGTSPGSA